MNAPLDKIAESAMQAAAQNGQLVLLTEILKWAGTHKACLTDQALRELLELAERYGA